MFLFFFPENGAFNMYFVQEYLPQSQRIEVWNHPSIFIPKLSVSKNEKLYLLFFIR
jgi:hypothetical protein